MKKEITDLEGYNPINDQKVKSREEFLNNAKKLFDIRSKTIMAFQDDIFQLSKENLHKEEKKRRAKRRHNS